MRKIKFRVWDIDGNQFWDDSLGDWKIEFIDGKEPKLIVLEETFSPYGEQEFYWRDVEDVVFQQYTGLKDKNGKEVYEGDVVKNHFDKTDLYDAYDEIGVVKIPNLFYGAVIVDELHGVNYRHFAHSEVIGNIYENPELLGGKKP